MTAAATATSSKRSMPTVELFPFLAVLVCAMGALILVLMILTRQARTQHAREARAKMAQHRVDLKNATQSVAGKVQQLKRSQQTAAAQLAESRLKLGHVEDHFHQLQEQLGGLQKAWKDLDDFGKHDAQKRDEQEAELDRLKAEIAKVEKEITNAGAAGPLRKRSFAIVPYEGPYGTHRRPIYVECCGDAIILQPEGIIMPEADFQEPLGPDNTLATALRAVREYWSRHNAAVPA
jgi:septal ring factor EnvC (AmiA/AmiB activator)